MRTLRHTTTDGQYASASGPSALDVVRTLLERFTAGDFAGAAGLLADDVVVVVAGDGSLAGWYLGPAAWQAYATALRRLGDGTYHAAEVEALGGTSYAALVMLATIHAGTDREASWRRQALYHIRDERIQEIWLTDLEAPGAAGGASGTTTVDGAVP